MSLPTCISTVVNPRLFASPVPCLILIQIFCPTHTLSFYHTVYPNIFRYVAFSFSRAAFLRCRRRSSSPEMALSSFAIESASTNTLSASSSSLSVT